MQAEHELGFDLPKLLTAPECRVGLDARVERGGAARARVLVDDSRRFESPLLVGGQQQVVIPPVKLGPLQTLVVGGGHGYRCPGRQ